MGRNKLIKSWLWVVLPLTFIVLLFLFRDSLIRLSSTEIRRMQGQEEATGMADSVKLLFDYSNGQSGFRYTFLEFGAKGCLSCRKMEMVMEDVRNGYAGRVNVRFFNLSKKECQPWAQYFGVATIPTQVILDDSGCEIFRHTGYISKEDLEKVFVGL